MEVIRYRTSVGGEWREMTGFIGPVGPAGKDGKDGLSESEVITLINQYGGGGSGSGMTEAEVIVLIQKELGAIEDGSY